jgi:hypothetical protein
MSTGVATTDMSTDNYPSTEIDTNVSLTLDPNERANLGKFDDCFYQLLNILWIILVDETHAQQNTTGNLDRSNDLVASSNHQVKNPVFCILSLL